MIRLLPVLSLVSLLLAGTAAGHAVVVAESPSAAAKANPEPQPVRSPPAATVRTAALFGADVRSLAVAPQQPDLVLAGTSAGHVYRSDDGGQTWREAGPGLPLAGYVVGHLAFDPNHPQRLWAAIWGIWGGGSVVVSDDLGATWSRRAEGLADEQIYTLTAVPGRPGRLYAAARSGVWGSEDDGMHWRLLSAGVEGLIQVSSLLVDPYRPETVIAGTWRRAFRSDDAGRTWRGIFEGMVLDTEVFSLHADPRRRGEVWASTCGWVYQTPDFGGRWQRFTSGLAERRTPSFGILFEGRLLAGTVAGLYTSDDRGASWQRRTATDLAVLAIATHPARPQRVWIGTEGSGVWRSDDGGQSFVASTVGMTNVRVAALVRAGGEVLAAVKHAGPSSGIHRSRDGGRTFAGRPEPLPTVLDLAAAGAEVWAATEGGLYVASGSASWQRVGELGSGRVEQVELAGDRVVVRTPQGIWERPPGGGLFRQIPYRHLPPRAVALLDDALWVADGEGIYRLRGQENHTVEGPAAATRLARLRDRVVLASRAGVWRGGDEGGGWEQLHGQSARLLDTGDPQHPLLLAETEGAQRLWRWATEAGRLEPLATPIPGREVLSALVVDGRLLLGTSGYGLLELELAP
jgi:photosystem II stability/assembly factor-like uncharacterized protein